jgi:AcrR family transcriptional regulator
MGRRSDRSRAELEALIVEEGHRHMAEVGYAAFSAREVAKRIGYSIGTLYNVFGSYDRLILAINTHTFQLWAEDARQRMAQPGEDRIRMLVESYFAFARENRNAWMAIYDHRLPPGIEMPEEEAAKRAPLTNLVVDEIAALLPSDRQEEARSLARSLIATVHGHCVFALNGSFALMGETAPFDQALARVRDALTMALQK